jgi:hypothetical protein
VLVYRWLSGLASCSARLANNVLNRLFESMLVGRASQPNSLARWALAARELRWKLSAGRNPVYLEFLPTCKPRYGYGHAPHRQLEELISRNVDAYRDHLYSLSTFAEELGRIPLSPQAAHEPFWGNGWFGSLNAATLYYFLRSTKPRTFLEVGSGNSTKFARRAINDGQTDTKIISIDPAPRADIDGICDSILRVPLQDVDIRVFDALGEGDIVLVDNSHLCLQNSDVTVFFLDVLPRMRKGVLIYIDDIFLPYDYPPQWSERYYSEQYVLAAVLLCKQSGLEIVMPCTYVQHHPELSSLVDQVWSKAGIPPPAGFVKGIWVRTC